MLPSGVFPSAMQIQEQQSVLVELYVARLMGGQLGMVSQAEVQAIFGVFASLMQIQVQ